MERRQLEVRDGQHRLVHEGHEAEHDECDDPRQEPGQGDAELAPAAAVLGRGADGSGIAPGQHAPQAVAKRPEHPLQGDAGGQAQRGGQHEDVLRPLRRPEEQEDEGDPKPQRVHAMASPEVAEAGDREHRDQQVQRHQERPRRMERHGARQPNQWLP